ncbi:MAG: aspartate aminotransferase family protein [Thermodesulfobacteriota bacterium]
MNSKEVTDLMNRYVMGTYNRLPITLKMGKGSWVWDNEENKYLDYTCGIAVTNLGHSNKKILNNIKNQLNEIIHTSNLFNIESQAKLAKMLVENSFADKVFFCNTGTEAVEAAIKLSRKWGKKNGSRFKIISTYGGFHGRTFGSLSATGTKKYQEGYSPLLEGFVFVDYGSIDQIKEIVQTENICAVILEPIQGENGVIIPPKGYLENVSSICRENKILLILDEIQVGMGRTGKLFCYEHEKIEPDIMALAKALGNGIPCGAVLAKEDVAQHFTPGTHGTTFGGNPLAMSVACTVLESIFNDNLLPKCANNGEYFLNRIKDLKNEYSGYIKDSRGKGLILGIEFVDKDFAKKVFQICIKKGLLVILTVENVFRILPPINTNKEEIDFAVSVINESIKEAVSNE